METKPADGDIERRQRAQDADAVDRERVFFVRFAERRLLECSAWIEHAARQRHLTAVTAERVGAHGEHDVRAIVDRKDKQQARRMADARTIEARRPVAPRTWRKD